MRHVRRSTLSLAAVAMTIGVLVAACGGSSTSSETAAETSSAAGGSADAGAPAAGAMSDASFAVVTYLDTIWPIEGNDYADAESVTSWCATYATDPTGAVASVAEYLSVEPDIAAADPASVTTAIDEYLTNNCYLIEG